jgi:hypothetical protein
MAAAFAMRPWPGYGPVGAAPFQIQVFGASSIRAVSRAMEASGPPSIKSTAWAIHFSIFLFAYIAFTHTPAHCFK